MLLGLANSRMPVVVLKPLAASTDKFVRDELAPYATFCLDLLRYRLGNVGLPPQALALDSSASWLAWHPPRLRG